MHQYAEIYGGLVRDLKESNLDYTEFCSIFDPASYWLDVTGVEDIDIGHIIKFSPERGTYFEAPPLLPVEETLETKRAAKLELLNALFAQEAKNAYVDSSLGFRADADDEASRNVGGLVTLLSDSPEETVQFCDYNNIMQNLTLTELKVLEKEILLNGSSFYQQKWNFRDAIKAAGTEEELAAVNICFTNMSFLPNEKVSS